MTNLLACLEAGLNASLMVTLRIMPLWKGMMPIYPPNNGLKINTTRFFKDRFGMKKSSKVNTH